MAGRDIFGLLSALVVLAMFSRAVISGDQTAQILKASGDSFATVIHAATLS